MNTPDYDTIIEQVLDQIKDHPHKGEILLLLLDQMRDDWDFYSSMKGLIYG